MTRSAAWFALVLATSLAGCSDDDVIKDAETLTQRLAEARPGETIRLGARDYVGTFVLTPGVSLIGSQSGTTLLRPPEDGTGTDPTLAVITGAEGENRISHISVGSLGARAAVAAFGAGTLHVEDTQLLVGAGLGMAAENLSLLTLTDTTVAGNVQPTSREQIMLPMPGEVSTHGIVTVGVREVMLDAVDVNGMSAAGALFVDSATTWQGSTVRENIGAGIFVSGGTAELNAISVADTSNGENLIPAYQIIVAGGADVRTTDTAVMNGGGLGVICDGSMFGGEMFVADGHGDAGMWLQNACNADLSGGSISSSKVAGVAVVTGSHLDIRESEVTGTELATRLFGEVGTVMVGDGVQLSGMSTATLTDTTLGENMRTGLLWDLGGSPGTGVTFATVTVRGDTLGAIAQNGTAPAGWDAAISREGSTEANDAAHTDVLDLIGVVAPSDFSDRSGASGVAEMGLEAVGIVMPTL